MTAGLRRLWLLQVVASAAGVAGCSGPTVAHRDPPTTQEFADLWGHPVTVQSRAETVKVTTGRAPLVYMTQGEEIISIVDDAGHRWGPVTLPTRSIVRVSEETGIAAGADRLFSGRLQPGRTYTVEVEVPDVAAAKPGERRAP